MIVAQNEKKQETFVTTTRIVFLNFKNIQLFKYLGYGHIYGNRPCGDATAPIHTSRCRKRRVREQIMLDNITGKRRITLYQRVCQAWYSWPKTPFEGKAISSSGLLKAFDADDRE